MNWTDKLLNEFANCKIYKVGGCVRDALRGVKPKDEDYLVTGVPFNELISFLDRNGYVQHVGATFGVLKFKRFALKDEDENKIPTVDISLPRKEISVGPGHKDFKVEFDHTIPVEEDLLRRDFTMNAIAQSITDGVLIDPFHGVSDIKSKIIRHVSKNSFIEDPLRILRAIQFATRFGFNLAPSTKDAIEKAKKLLVHIPIERATMEFMKLMTAAKPSFGFELLNSFYLLKHYFPALHGCKKVAQSRKGIAANVYAHTLLAIDASPIDNMVVRWATLYHDVGKPRCRKVINGKEHFLTHEIISAQLATKELNNFKFPKDFIENVTHLITYHMFDAAPRITPKAVRRLIKKVGPEHIFNLVELRKADRQGTSKKMSMWKIDNLIDKIKKELADKPFSVNDLAFNGNSIMEFTGLNSGPEVGLIQKILLNYVLFHDVPNTIRDLLQFMPYPIDGSQEYCPHGTRYRLTKLLENLDLEKETLWNCGSDCGFMCEKRY